MFCKNKSTIKLFKARKIKFKNLELQINFPRLTTTLIDNNFTITDGLHKALRSLANRSLTMP